MKTTLLTLIFTLSSIVLSFGQIACPDTVCVGDNVTYSVNNTAGSTYNWTLSPGGPLVPTINSQNLTWNVTPGAYSLTVVETNQFNCVGLPQTCIVEVVDVIADFTQIGPFCEGNSIVNLIGTPAGGVFSGPFVTGNTFNPSTPGTYNLTYTYTNAQGCIATDTITVVVNPTPNTTPINHN